MKNRLEVLSLQLCYLCLLFCRNMHCQPSDENFEDDIDSDSISNEIFSKNMSVKPNTVISELSNNVIDNITQTPKRCNQDTLTSILADGLVNKSAIYPFSVSIQKKASHFASGVLIHSKWILTAAAEFYNVRESIKLYRARLGSVNCKRGGVLVPLKDIVIHPSYVYKEPNFDIAMFKMAIAIEYNEFVQPIALTEVKGRVESARFLTFYWPRLIIKGRILPYSAKERINQYNMRISTQSMISWRSCVASLQPYTKLDRSSLCLKTVVSHHSPCMPDAGAPVLAEDGLWGITSGWTPKNCSSHNFPTIFTRISSPLVRSWLLQHTGK